MCSSIKRMFVCTECLTFCLPDAGSQGKLALTRRCLGTPPGRVVGRNPSACSSRPLTILSPRRVSSEHSRWESCPVSVCPAHPGPTHRGMRAGSRGSFLLAVTPPVQLVLLLVGRKSRGKSHTFLLASVPRAPPPPSAPKPQVSLLCCPAAGHRVLSRWNTREAKPHSLALRLSSPAAGLTIPPTCGSAKALLANGLKLGPPKCLTPHTNH